MAAWRTATASDSGSCVEAGDGNAAVGVRDSMDRDGPVLTFTPEAWQAFTAALKAEPAAPH